MKKHNIFLILIIVLIISTFFVSCTSIKFSDLKIEANNVDNVAVGEYTLEYSIDNIEKLSEKYDLNLYVSIVDYDNNDIVVNNNRTFEVVANNIYYVQITVSGIIDGTYQSVKKDMIITAIKTDPQLIMKMYALDTPYSWTTMDLKSGQSVSIDALPEIPDFIPNTPGQIYTITKKEWIYLDKLNKEIPLTANYLSNIEITKTIYAKFTYSSTPKIYTITFDTQGGTDISAITQAYNASINSSAPIPTKSNNFFLGWYLDEEYQEIFVWENLMQTTRTLFAKWEEYNTNNTDSNLFDFTLKNTNN
ncbi:MAG: InlB B-repeat-containing protein, partial [Clostridia bacterium]